MCGSIRPISLHRYRYDNGSPRLFRYLFRGLRPALRPWLTPKWVRRLLTNVYRNDVNGISGNEDVGQMSAWYVPGAMGFYPVCPGDGIYIVGSPLFSRVTLHLEEKWYKGAKSTIAAENQATDHPYVQSVKLNGKPLSRAWIRHTEIAAEGILEFVMGSEPNRKWATLGVDLLPSMST
jgi:putative alpha-1,2-mannosidase